MKTSLLKAITITGFAFLIAIPLYQCQEKPTNLGAVHQVAIKPVSFPTNIVPGFKFPEDTTTIINDWLGGYTAPYFDTVQIYQHAWGIWAGLTAPSGQFWNGQELLVYETWPGITDIQAMIENNKLTATLARTGRVPLSRPNQLEHAQKRAKAGLSAIPVDSINEEGSDFWVAVSYDPTAANHAVTNKLLSQSYLASKVRAGEINAIPAFPNTSITIKPSFLVGRVSDKVVKIPAWPGPPNPAANFPDTDWNSWVYVDMNQTKPSGKSVVPVPNGNPTPVQIAAATCNLGDFIYYRLDSVAAAYLNKQESSQGVKAQAGDVALLVAMHVTTKEISNWTWQTFFWAPDPNNPPLPSDAVAAAQRPSQLSAAASHYAVATTYAMVRPNQPITGGTNTGVNAVIGYNPYLEPNLGQLNDPKTNPNNLSPAYMWGVQSNCMSCHAQAYYPANFIYTADQYVDMRNPSFFNGTVQLDFAWSIAANLVK